MGCGRARTVDVEWGIDPSASRPGDCGCRCSDRANAVLESGQGSPRRLDESGAGLLTVDALAMEARATLFASRDSALMRAFRVFWPRGVTGPPSLPWLGGLVDRTSAYSWASGFADELAGIDPGDRDRIAGFVFDSLVSEEPAFVSRRRVCRRPPRPPVPPLDPNLPDTGRCKDESYYSCLECPPGKGKKIDVYPDCHTVKHDICVSTSACPGTGPIEPEGVLWSG